MHSTLITRSGVQATVLGQSASRFPLGGKIGAGIKVLTRQAVKQPQAQATIDRPCAQPPGCNTASQPSLLRRITL